VPTSVYSVTPLTTADVSLDHAAAVGDPGNHEMTVKHELNQGTRLDNSVNAQACSLSLCCHSLPSPCLEYVSNVYVKDERDYDDLEEKCQGAIPVRLFSPFLNPLKILFFFQIKILYTMPSTSSSLSSLREPSPTHHIIETVPIDNEGIYFIFEKKVF